MIEQQRLHYLAALGIDSYIPKRRLSHASPSGLLVAFKPEEDESIESAPIQSSSDNPVAVALNTHDDSPIADVVETGSEYLQGDLPPASPHPVESDSQLAMNAEEMPQKQAAYSVPSLSEDAGQTSNIVSGTFAKPLRFTLSVWPISPSLLVVDTRQTGSALPTDKLLQNILRAVGYPMAQLPPSELIRWPIFKQDPQANNSAEALAMVQANIGARCAKAPGLQILLMGEIATDFVINGSDEYTSYEQHLGQVVQCEAWQASAIVLPSLVEILETPSKKALVWQALQVLLDVKH